MYLIIFNSIFSVNGFGRRASDGGANLEMFFHRQMEGVWSQPGSNEQIQMVKLFYFSKRKKTRREAI